jgi:colanic acid/amylovoran biosynthesis glycosyltransferase
MRIAYFINQYPKVSHTFIRSEIMTLESLGVNVTRFALRGWDAEVADPLDEGERARTRYILKHGILNVLTLALIEFIRGPMAFALALRLAIQIAWKGDRTVLHHLFSAAEGAVLARWARQEGIQHVHAHFGTNPAEIVMLANAISGLPYSFTVHGADEWDMPRQLKIAEKVRHARFVIAISHFTRAQVLRWARTEDHAKVHVVHCGLGDEYLDRPAARLPQEPNFVCVGRLCTAKSQHLIVEAIARLKARGIFARLVLVGDGEMRGSIESTIRAYGLEDRVCITGWASGEKVRQEIECARIFLLPSLAEGLPVAIMEAMALGRPIVATYVGGIPELVRNDQEGWLVPASDVDSITEAISRALALDQDVLAGMGRAAQRRVSERHRSRVEVGKLLALFQRAVAAS